MLIWHLFLQNPNTNLLPIFKSPNIIFGNYLQKLKYYFWQLLIKAQMLIDTYFYKAQILIWHLFTKAQILFWQLFHKA